MSTLPASLETSRDEMPSKGRGWIPAFVTLVTVFAYIVAILSASEQLVVLGILAAGLGGGLLAFRLGWWRAVGCSFAHYENFSAPLVVIGILATALVFHANSFVLFLMATILVNMTACLGLNIQFGYAGMLNFAGASMLGIGAYSAAYFGQNESIPAILLLPLGGICAVVGGSLLLPPMLRTQGHYSAVVTIAFALLFITLLDSFAPLGGSQGMPLRALTILGWDFSQPFSIGGIIFEFYMNYLLVALLLAVVTFVLVRRIDRSWLGLTLDTVRSDETAAACFGISIVRAKIFAFTAGNFIMGTAGALYALMLGYIAPSNFSFGDSLILVTIIILGGLGSLWGTIATTAIIFILPERLQAIQEYRLLIYSSIVLIVLLFAPRGLIPRPVRKYFPQRGGS